jgi:NADH-quinone oxidoreductase subunit J
VTSEEVAFVAIAAVMMVAALSVVTTRNVVRAALSLVIVLAGVAAQYILLAAEFTAVVQVMVYIGAVVVLFLFGIMLTRPVLGRAPDLDNDQRPIAAVTAVFLLGVLSFALVDAFEDTKLPELAGDAASVAAERGTRPVGDAIFSTYLVPFEVVSVLLLAALVGAIVLARKD